MIEEAKLKISLERSLESDLAAFRSAGERTERDEKMETERIVSLRVGKRWRRC